MKVFTYHKGGITAIVTAFNRGHAVKMLAKELESRGLELTKDDPVVELDLEDEKKGKVTIIS